jgi:hypothetical protein
METDWDIHLPTGVSGQTDGRGHVRTWDEVAQLLTVTQLSSPLFGLTASA